MAIPSSEPRKTALITGGAHRVGRAIVQRLSAEGYDVIFSYLTRKDQAQELVDQILSQGRPAMAFQADLSDPQAAVAAVQKALKQANIQQLHALVHNASVYHPSPIGNLTLDQIRQPMAVHYESPLLITQALAPLLRAGQGHVICMADILADKPWPEYLAYCASKAALVNLTKSLARALAPEVTVNAIAPGVVAWPDDFPESEQVKYLARVPLGRPGEPADVAELVAFLCEGGKYITGQIIPLDGGRSLMS